MTAKQIEQLLEDQNFSKNEMKAFVEIIEKAKECQGTNNMDILGAFINTKIDEVISHEI